MTPRKLALHRPWECAVRDGRVDNLHDIGGSHPMVTAFGDKNKLSWVDVFAMITDELVVLAETMAGQELVFAGGLTRDEAVAAEKTLMQLKWCSRAG